MNKTVLVIGSMVSAMVLACMATVLTATPGGGKTQTVTLVGAGDIAGCDFKHDRKTARLVGKTPGTVFTLGDHAYPEGTRAQFRNCYDPHLGQIQEAHEAHPWQPRVRHLLRGEALLRLLRMACGQANPRLLLLRSRLLAHRGPKQQLQGGRGCEWRSSQGRWLRRDLAKNRGRCTLAYFHHPLYASGNGYDSPEVKPFWHILYNHHADVILHGNTHRYERFARITPSGERSSSRGIRQFIVGTGGAPGGTQHGADEPRVQAKKVGAPGVLMLELGSGFYHWKFVPVAGRNYTDSGKARCH